MTIVATPLSINNRLMPLRIATSLTICLAVFTGSCLGLNKGMVICFDGDGHLALESAHARHAECHEGGSDHRPQEYPAGSEHAELHSALEACFDAAIGNVTFRSCTVPPLRPFDAPVASLFILHDLERYLAVLRAEQANPTSRVIPRPEVARLSTVVLIV